MTSRQSGLILGAFLLFLTGIPRTAPARDQGALTPTAVTGLDGDPIRLTPRPGHFYYLHFWASWCGGCMLEMPSTVKLYNSLPGDKVHFISISLDYRKEKARQAVETQKITFPVIFSGKGWEDPFVTRLGVESIPHNFILDGELNIIAENIFGPDLNRALSALDRGDLEAWRKIQGRMAEERADLAEIERLLKTENREAAVPLMEEFLEKHPDSSAAAGVRRYLAGLEEGGGEGPPARSPEELKPPGFDLPDEVYVPAFEVGSPGKVTSGYLRQLTGALEAYREDHGRFPGSLRDLTRDGAYLADLPQDPYGGEIRYHTDGETFWIMAAKGPDRTEDTSLDEYNGNPQTVAGTLYRDEDQEAPQDSPRTGDIVAYRSLAGSRTGTQ
jgi:thiol-disulfide isomerase/thioredoxin